MHRPRSLFTLRRPAAAIIGGTLALSIAAASCAIAAPAQRSRPARPQAKRPQLCVRYRCVTVAADVAGMEILYVTERRKGKYVIGTFARWQQSGHISKLGKELEHIYGEGPTERRPIALAGRYVAYAVVGCTGTPQCPGSENVTRVNVKSGRRLTGEGGTVDDIVVTSGGAVAWIEKAIKPTAAGLESGIPEVKTASTKAGFKNPTTLAASSSIESHTLALAGDHLYWSEAGQPRTATIE